MLPGARLWKYPLSIPETVLHVSLTVNLLHLVKCLAKEGTSRLEHPMTLRASETLKILALNPDQFARHCHIISQNNAGSVLDILYRHDLWPDMAKYSTEQSYSAVILARGGPLRVDASRCGVQLLFICEMEGMIQGFVVAIWTASLVTIGREHRFWHNSERVAQ
jgi:hypothetical protein